MTEIESYKLTLELIVVALVVVVELDMLELVMLGLVMVEIRTEMEVSFTYMR